ncbi:MAG: YncE family protein [Sphingomonadales bacterium]
MPGSLAAIVKYALAALLLALIPVLRAQACGPDPSYYLSDIALSPDASLTYVTDEVNGKVWVISLADHRTVRSGAIDGAPQAIVLTRDGSEALVATSFGPIIAIDAKTLKPRLTLAAGKDIRALDLSADGKVVYTVASKEGTNSVMALERKTGALIFERPIGGWSWNIRVSPSSKVYVTTMMPKRAGSAIEVIDGETGKFLKRLPLPDSGRDIEFSADGAVGYVSIYGGIRNRGQIIRFDARRDILGDGIRMRGTLSDLAVLPGSGAVYALDDAPDLTTTVAVIAPDLSRVLSRTAIDPAQKIVMPTRSGSKVHVLTGLTDNQRILTLDAPAQKPVPVVPLEMAGHEVGTCGVS